MPQRSTLAFSGVPGPLRTLAPAYSTPPTMPSSAWDLSFVLHDAAGSFTWPVYPMTATVGHDATMNGRASLVFPKWDEAAQYFMGATLGQEFPNVSLRVWLRGRNIWSGPVVSSSFRTGRTAGTVELLIEHFWSYFLRRRSVYATLLAAIDLTAAVENIALATARDQIGPSPITPSGHPGGRDDFGPFSPGVSHDHGSPTSPSKRLIEQSGNNLLDIMNGWCETHGLAPSLTDPLTQSFLLDLEYPFQDVDLSSSILFSQYMGNLAGFEFVSDRSALANVFAVEGKTAKSMEFSVDTASVALWGTSESFVQKPEDTHVSAVMVTTADDLVAKYGGPKLTYRADIIEVPGRQFVTDWFWRNKIAIADDTLGILAEGSVQAWELKTDDYARPHVDVVLGQPRYADIMREIVGYVGLGGPRMHGSPYRNRRQA